MPNADSTPPHRPAATDLRRAYAGRPVLVAGADGFLGVNCAAALHAAGAVVTLLSRQERPRALAFADRHVRADLRDADAMAAAVAGQAFVFDLAGTSGAVGSNLDPSGSVDQDCRPHLNLFAAAAAAASRPVVAFCSSRLVYGRPVRLPVGEDHPVAPASFYAVNKLTLEHYLRVLGGTHGLRSVVFRLSNPYGPFWPAERKSYGIINQFIARALAGEPITIFGDGSQRRDYIHVDDVSAALLATATVGACAGQTFNLGGDEPLSIAEAVGEIAQQVGDAVVRYAPWPAEHLAVETGDYRTDGSKLRRFVDLPPPIAFRDGLRRTLASVRAGLPAGGIRGYPPSAAGAETRPSAAAEGTQA